MLCKARCRQSRCISLEADLIWCEPQAAIQNKAKGSGCKKSTKHLVLRLHVALNPAVLSHCLVDILSLIIVFLPFSPGPVRAKLRPTF